MIIEKTQIEGCYILCPKIFKDVRGRFVKNFNEDMFKNFQIDTDFKEAYYSVSNKSVARGMHFQIPPHDHSKLVYVSHGRILDLVMDLRKSSTTYGKVIQLELDSKTGKQVYLAKGLAHGFITLEDHSVVHYMQTSVYAPESDAGIHLSSTLDNVERYILSDRDQTHPTFKEFDSPFP